MRRCRSIEKFGAILTTSAQAANVPDDAQKWPVVSLLDGELRGPRAVLSEAREPSGCHR